MDIRNALEQLIVSQKNVEKRGLTEEEHQDEVKRKLAQDTVIGELLKKLILLC